MSLHKHFGESASRPINKIKKQKDKEQGRKKFYKRKARRILNNPYYFLKLDGCEILPI